VYTEIWRAQVGEGIDGGALPCLQLAGYHGQTLVNDVSVNAVIQLHVTLLDPSASKSLDNSINADIIHEGLAMVPRKLISVQIALIQRKI
jgi:hypothetical protein